MPSNAKKSIANLELFINKPAFKNEGKTKILLDKQKMRAFTIIRLLNFIRKKENDLKRKI